jgi:hypothetical protein
LTGTPSRRQDSITERIAATFGPDCALPTCNYICSRAQQQAEDYCVTLYSNP